MIPVYTPKIYKESVIQCIESGWISSQGEFLEKTRASFVNFFQIPHVILMNNGTSATHMLIKALKFKHPEIKKVYVPNHVFVAVWNAVLYEYSKDQIQVMETDSKTLNMRTDESYIMSLEKNAAVMIVHNIGNIINVPRLKRLRPDLVFVEDNCEGFFGTYEGTYSGMSSVSLCSAVSFFGNKTITCGEGGAFFTHDSEVYDFIYRTIHHGLSDQRYVFGMLGYNYRMTNIEAALLYDQMRHIDEIRTNKHRVFEMYRDKLKDSVILPEYEENTTQSEWMFVCGLKNIDYSAFQNYMNSNNIDIRPFFYDVKVHRHLQDMKSTPLSNNITYFMLPSFPDLTNEQIEYICEMVLKYTV